MNLLFAVALVLVLPSAYLAREVVERDPSSARGNFIFPKDRKGGVESRIIGGQEVNPPHSYPFVVALNIYTRSQIYFCGGSLIEQNIVLTAAHCVQTDPPALYALVLVGAHNITVSETGTELFNTTDWVYHGSWDEDLLQNDVALIKLPKNVTLSDRVKTVPYATGDDKYEQVASTSIGWGKTETSVSVNSVLKSVNTTTLTNDACKSQNLALAEIVIDSHLCISGEGIRGTCSGDSGGPLIVDGVQVGIVSFGFTDCTLGLPSVFTRVSHFKEWIGRGGASSYENLYYSLIVSVALSMIHLFRCM